MTLDGFLDLVARHRSNHLLGNLSTLEDEQRGNSADVELACRVRVFVDVQFHDFDLACVGGRDISDSWRQHEARPAPLCSKFDHHRLGLACVDDLSLECAICNIANIICHELPFVWRLRGHNNPFCLALIRCSCGLSDSGLPRHLVKLCVFYCGRLPGE